MSEQLMLMLDNVLRHLSHLPVWIMEHENEGDHKAS